MRATVKLSLPNSNPPPAGGRDLGYDLEQLRVPLAAFYTVGHVTRQPSHSGDILGTAIADGVVSKYAYLVVDV